MAPQVAALKLKHVEHILEVLRCAEKQEAARQRRLKHATGTKNLAYLQKRFDAERRKDQIHISRLVHDANAVEAAMLRCPQQLQGHNGQTGHSRRTDVVEGDEEPLHDGGHAGTVGTRGWGSSIGGPVGTTSKLSNAYLEPSEPKEDPNFISLDQMRFMKHVYLRVDGRQAGGAHTRLMTQQVGDKKTACQVSACEQPRRLSNGDKNRIACDQASPRSTGPLAGLSAARGQCKVEHSTYDSTNATIRRRRRRRAAEGAQGTALPHQGSVGGNDGNSGSRQRRLLKQKREILLQMKGVISRQTEALDRLVESSVTRNRGEEIVEEAAIAATTEEAGIFKQATPRVARQRAASFITEEKFVTEGPGLIRKHSVKPPGGRHVQIVS